MVKARDFKTLEEWKQHLLSLKQHKRGRGINSNSRAVVFRMSIPDEVRLIEQSRKLNMGVSTYVREAVLRSLKTDGRKK
jgi:hypothetical protein